MLVFPYVSFVSPSPPLARCYAPPLSPSSAPDLNKITPMPPTPVYTCAREMVAFVSNDGLCSVYMMEKSASRQLKVLKHSNRSTKCVEFSPGPPRSLARSPARSLSRSLNITSSLGGRR